MNWNGGGGGEERDGRPACHWCLSKEFCPSGLGRIQPGSTLPGDHSVHKCSVFRWPQPPNWHLLIFCWNTYCEMLVSMTIPDFEFRAPKGSPNRVLTNERQQILAKERVLSQDGGRFQNNFSCIKSSWKCSFVQIVRKSVPKVLH